MVVSSENMPTEPERSRTLHNFAFPKSRWGIQRHMKCVTDESTTGPSGGDSGVHNKRLILKFRNTSVVIPFRLGEINQPSHQKRNSTPESENMSLAEVLDLFWAIWVSELEQMKRDRKAESLKKAVVKDDAEDKEKKPEDVIDWWLERRTIAAINEDQFEELIGVSNENQSKKLRTEERLMTRKRGRDVKFSLQLSRKEIEEDLMQIMGRRAERRPKKRSRNVQKEIDNAFPGLYLTKVTPDMYKV